MERIQAGYLYVGEADKELERHRDFLYTPDEKEFTVDEYVSEYGNALGQKHFENAYDIYRNIRFNLKKKQEEWFKSNDSIEL